MRRAVLVVTITLLFAACGDGRAKVDVGSGDEPGPPAEDVTLTCGEGLPFLVSALDGPTGAEEADTPEAEVLREIIAEAEGRPEGDGVPATGWRVLAEHPAGVFFGAGEPPRMAMATVWRENGVLDAGPSGACVTRRYREGFEIADWEVHGSPPLDSTVLVVDVTESACADGEPPGERLQPAEVVEDDESVTVTFWIATQSGDHTCPGNPSTPVSVELDEALGDRTLFDGGPYPPQDRFGGDDATTTTVTTGTTTPVESPTSSVPVPSTTVPEPGPPPDDIAAAEEAIADAYRIAWDGSLTQAERLARVENGWATAEAGNEVKRLYPDAVASLRVEVVDVQFVNSTYATLDFELHYENAPALPPQEGEAVVQDGVWKVAFATRCAVIRQTMVECP